MDRQVVIVGAGLAGASAALRLAKAGTGCTVLEARDRVGGRALTRAFGGAGPDLEFGGAWITPWQHRMRALAEAHGLELRPRHPVTLRRWLSDGALHDTGPTSEADRARHERAIARVAADAMLMKAGHSADEKGRPLTGVSFADYLDRLNPPAATRALFSAWWTVSGNGDPAIVAAGEFLASCTYSDGLAEGMIGVWAHTLVPGVQVLAERMLRASGAELVTGQPVTAIEYGAEHVELVCGDGARLRCGHCILALGVNQHAALEFTPPLSGPRETIVARGHDGRAFKLWISAEGVAPGTLVTGDGTGLEFAFAERAGPDGATMIVGFGLTGGGAEPGDPQWVAGQVSRLFPNAHMLRHDWHDWVGDPFARGTWVAAPAGMEEGFDARQWSTMGPLRFASSDIAREQAGWFEAAVLSGEDAADDVLASLGHPPRAA